MQIGDVPSFTVQTARFALPYLDPKAADGQENEREVYDERCADVAREMLYVMSVAQGGA